MSPDTQQVNAQHQVFCIIPSAVAAFGFELPCRPDLTV